MSMIEENETSRKEDEPSYFMNGNMRNVMIGGGGEYVLCCFVLRSTCSPRLGLS